MTAVVSSDTTSAHIALMAQVALVPNPYQPPSRLLCAEHWFRSAAAACHVCRWYFSCKDWLGKAQGTSKVLPAQLEDPRQASALVHYQVRLLVLHMIAVMLGKAHNHNAPAKLYAKWVLS